MVRLVIADDHKMVRDAWALLLRRDKRIVVEGLCENGQEVINYCREKSPDIILMDINMEPVNGIEATREIRTFNNEVKIIGISVHTDLPYINALVQAGANGYVTKNSSGAEMIQAIFEVLEGKIFYCKEILALQNKAV